MNVKKRNALTFIIVIVVLLIPTTLAFVFRERLFMSNESTINMRIPIIRAVMESKNGERENVQAGFSVQFNPSERRTANQYNTNEMQNILNEILLDLDFDALSAFDGGVEYINAQASQLLAQRLGVDVQVVLTELYIGDEVRLETSDGGAVNDFMRGFFQRMN
jgi:hypothetical protein